MHRGFAFIIKTGEQPGESLAHLPALKIQLIDLHAIKFPREPII